MPTVQFSLAQAKRRFARAHAAALENDPSLRLFYDKWQADLLSAGKGVSTDRRAAMYFKMALVCEILAERRGWPNTIIGLQSRE
jgi:hypothetical protein